MTLPLCGWEWLQQHRHDLDGWHPTIEIVTPTSGTKIIIKDTKVINEIGKIHFSKSSIRGQ